MSYKTTIINIGYLIVLCYLFLLLGEAFPTKDRNLSKYTIIYSAKDHIFENTKDVISNSNESIINLRSCLLDYHPMPLRNIVEIDKFTNSCNLIYRPDGFQKKDWILLILRDKNTEVLALYYDKTIKEIDFNSILGCISECRFYHEAESW